MENPMKMDDLGVPLFLETPICSQVNRGSATAIHHGSWLAELLCGGEMS